MSDRMRAAVYHALDDIRVEERPIPEIGPGELLLRTLACGLCGSETMAWYKKSLPKVLGHEAVGEVVEVGAGVTEFRAGDRMFINHHVGRVDSHLSRRGHPTRDPFYASTRLDPGGVCGYYRVTAQHVAMDAHRLPDSISTDAAVTIEPWSCVLSGLKVSNIQPGDTVAVVGAGFMGQGFVHLAPLFGAGKVVALDYSDWRLDRAMEFGATHRINPGRNDAVESMRNANNGRLADTVVVTAPLVQAWEQAMTLVEVGGCLHLGAPLPPGTGWTREGSSAYFDQITITSRYSSDQTDTYSYIRLLESGRINAEQAISHRFGMEDSAEAFRLLVEAANSLKIVVYPHGIPPGREEVA